MYESVALPSGFSATLSNPISICLVLLALVVMPVAAILSMLILGFVQVGS